MRDEGPTTRFAAGQRLANVGSGAVSEVRLGCLQRCRSCVMVAYRVAFLRGLNFVDNAWERIGCQELNIWRQRVVEN